LDQQLAKNLYTADTMSAKVEQIELSFKLEAQYSKPQILEMYLAEVYFGHGFYGMPAAARGLFGVAPTDLSWGRRACSPGWSRPPVPTTPTNTGTWPSSGSGMCWSGSSRRTS